MSNLEIELVNNLGMACPDRLETGLVHGLGVY